MRKGQTIVIIVGLVFIAIVVVMLTWQALTAPSVPEAIKAEHQQIEASLTDLMRRGTVKVLKEVEAHGGYIVNTASPPDKWVIFMGRGVPMWHLCDINTIPNMDTAVIPMINKGITDYLRENLNETDVVSGKDVVYDFGSLSVSTNVLGGQVNVIVNLPTNIAGYLATKPYTATVPTLFGRIYDFAQDFVTEEMNTRFLEIYTSQRATVTPSMPNYMGVLHTCGANTIITAAELQAGLKSAIKETLLRLDLWSQEPSYGGAYPVFRVNGKQYKDLDITFWLPWRYEVPVEGDIVITNNERFYWSSKRSVNECFTFYTMEYEFFYPYVVRVKDPLLNNYFHFGGFVYTTNLNEPGDCVALGAQAPTGLPCETLPCSGELTVKDANGLGVEGAGVTFNGCYLGATDVFGTVKGAIKCGTGDLVMLKTGFEIFNKTVNANELDPAENASFTLNKVPSINLTVERVFKNETGDVLPCPREQYPINEHVTVNLAGTFHSFSNFNSSFDVEQCIVETPGYNGECEDCRSLIGSLVGGIDDAGDISPCKACQGYRAACEQQALLTRIELATVPAGDYHAVASIRNPAMVEQYGGFDFVTFPITISTDVTIPSEDGYMVLQVPDTDKMLEDAVEVYNNTYNGWYGQCMGGEWEMEICNVTNCTDDVCECWNQTMDACNVTGCMCTGDDPGCWKHADLRIAGRQDYTAICTFEDCMCIGGDVCDEDCAAEKAFPAAQNYLETRISEHNETVKTCGGILY